MPLWVFITLSAALFQCWRTALQQRLRGQLSLNAAAVVRYLYGVPVGAMILLVYWLIFGGSFGPVSWWFIALCAMAGLGQIFGTNLLISSFGPRGFAVGTAYSKTEAVQASLLSIILLGEVLPALSWLGIAISVFGVMYLTLAGRGLSGRDIWRATFQPAALCGIGAGAFFAFTSIFVRKANLELPGEDAILKALFSVVVTNMIQTALQGGWLLLAEPKQLVAVFRSWRSSMQVGALSAFGSSCWFVGFSLAPVALVRAVGQVEIVFTLLFSRFFLGERLKTKDVVGALTLVGGVVLVLLGALR
ncbi:DMT family transporter [Roseococcus sp. SYP-B2431]|uniref:DMT family transporter n=1 Tax=Roseococcus sp. SYP-B2431 TaxID=2496640 RepID=UPI00103D15C5|nr:DMT family transporter [Roseococcus sp. SYP-B2431]TCH98993.1 DMT family transporter [Roseococcus sp. SYP-B2431]